MRNYNIATLFLVFLALNLTSFSLHADDNSEWMGRVSDNTFVSQLSIPGAHDAATGHGFASGGINSYGDNFAETQTLSLTQQWNAGIRAFDLRPAVKSGSPESLYIWHGCIQTKLTMQSALETLCSLLDQHPDETAIVIVRHETDAYYNYYIWSNSVDNSTQKWNNMMTSLLTSNSTIASHLIDYTPEMKLGEARGKLLFLSRNEYATTPSGGFIRNWNSNASFSSQQGGTIVGPNGQSSCYIQDYYNMTASGGPATKTTAIERMLQFSTQENTDPGLWVINQTSGYSKTTTINLVFWESDPFPSSDGYADNAWTQNPVPINYLSSHPGPAGIVLMDYAGVNTKDGYAVNGLNLANAIVNSNFTEGPHADYFRALGILESGSGYVVSTIVNGVKYYLTTQGTLTSTLSQAGYFTFNRVAGNQYKYGYQLAPAFFTNPDRNGDNVILNSGSIATNASARADWEAQVLFCNAQGKYAVRATNATSSTSGWGLAGNTYWTVNTGNGEPKAEYSFNKEYIWNIEKPSGVLNVTYNIMHNNQLLKSVVVEQLTGSATQLPAEFDNRYTSYTYSVATIDAGHTTVIVEATFETPFRFSTNYATARWYYLRGHADITLWGDRYVYTDGNTVAWGEGYQDTDAYKWAFLGNPINGIQLINKATGESAYLTNTDPVSMGTSPYTWEFRKQTAFFGSTGEPEGVEAFLFIDTSRNQYLNVHGNQSILSYWHSSDQGSTFWIENVEPDYLLGDVNDDGIITIADVTALVNIILGKDNGFTPLYNHNAADVNEDGSITIADVTSLVNLILGKQRQRRVGKNPTSVYR